MGVGGENGAHRSGGALDPPSGLDIGRFEGAGAPRGGVEFEREPRAIVLER